MGSQEEDIDCCIRIRTSRQKDFSSPTAHLRAQCLEVQGCEITERRTQVCRTFVTENNVGGAVSQVEVVAQLQPQHLVLVSGCCALLDVR
jgi:hypothetical protein